ncbi:hypothetical protein Vadar_003987 [Vaccinium darrowii]|uniref:Uncharacterized protein n=1 Tax=Vaccinium darrowii TaxID=229202 RepID=A0ACB7XY08_9ERIC|nr:hypothetical protein Vadar_003987 [Vaccinium darrowii]
MSSLSVLIDSLALVTYKVDRLGTESCFYIWVRDGNGVKDNWNKKYSIGPILGLYVAMGIRRNGELLLLWVNERHMVSYKLDTQNIKEYHNVVDDPAVIPFRVLSYAENLVSVKRQCLAS